MGGGVDSSGAAPADAGYGAFVAAKDDFYAFGDYVPYSDCAVFRRGGEAGAAGGLEMIWFPG